MLTRKKYLYPVVYLLFVLFIVIPIIYSVSTVFIFENSFLKNLQLLDSKMLFLLIKSCAIAFSVAILSTLIGGLLGFVLYKTKFKYKTFFKIALLIPLFISPYILAVAWKDFWFILFDNTSSISSSFGVILVLTFIFAPLSMLIIGSALSNINSQLEESGFMITVRRQVVLKIILPLIKPALITSFVLVFIFSISEFSVPAFFGVKVFTTEIFTQFSAFYNHSLAILQSTILVIICVLLLFAEKKHIANAPFLSIGKRGSNTKLYDLRSNKLLSHLFVVAWLIVSIVFPFFVLVIQAFKNGTSKFSQANDLLLPTFGNSIGLAFMGALIIVFVGFTFAYFTTRKSNTKGANVIDWLLLLVFSIPSTVYGISLIKFYNQPMLDFIYSSYAIILIGYVGKFTFISTKLIGNAIKQIPNSLDEVAQVHGITFLNRIFKILLPLILPALFVAFIISFIFSLSELGTTIMLYPPGTEIMPIKVFTIMANAPQSLTSSMALIVFSVTLLVVIGFYFLTQLFFKKPYFDYDKIK